MRRLLLAVLLTAAAGAVHAADERVEIRDGDEVLVLSPSPDGARLMLTVGGRELAFGECADELRSEVISPDSLTATVIERNCGATVDFATQVQLRSGEDQDTIAVFAGRVPVRLEWTATGLSVRHAPVSSGRIFRQAPEALGIAVDYQAAGDPAPESEYLNFSSFNYGATGRAAGLPAELLLRVAGWSQEASGLYRESWGRWSDPEAYGDDPQGNRQIRNCMRYFERSEAGQ